MAKKKKGARGGTGQMNQGLKFMYKKGSSKTATGKGSALAKTMGAGSGG